MNITFIAKGAENIGLEYLSAVLKNKGHNVNLVFDRSVFNEDTYINIKSLKHFTKSPSVIAKEVMDTKPDLIGFSVMTSTYQWSLVIAHRLKQAAKNIPIIFGGIHPTLAPEDVISHDQVDIICLGEGEGAVLDLVDSMKSRIINHDIKNLWFKKQRNIVKNDLRSPIRDLDTLPMPDKSLFEQVLPLSNCYLAVTSRGCSYACSYCSEVCVKELYKSKGNYYRQRSVDKVIEELLLMKQKYNFKIIDIRSSVLSYSKEWIYDFLEKYRENIKLPFRAMLYPKIVDDKMAKELKSSGCWQVQIGIQTFNSHIRKNILSRPETDKDIFDALNALENANMRFSVDIMTGLPEETPRDLILAADSLYKYKHLYKIALFYLQYLPGAPIIEHAKKCRILTDANVENINKGMVNNFFTTDKKEEARRLRDFQLLFRLLPILPKHILKFILSRKIYKVFSYMPQTLFIILIDIMQALISRDKFIFSTIKGYLWEIRKKTIY